MTKLLTNFLTIKDGFQNIHVIIRMVPCIKCVNKFYWSDDFALPRNFPFTEAITNCMTQLEKHFPCELKHIYLHLKRRLPAMGSLLFEIHTTKRALLYSPLPQVFSSE